ncbi:hypothetical protein ACTFIY_008018 [Dictyostelium cf. discoideum]
MINNQQFPLLNNKIENNDFILMDKKSIHTLFKEFSILSGTKDDDEKKRNEFEICDLTKSSIINNSIESIKILINEPYCINVYPSIINNSIESIKILINEPYCINVYPSTIELAFEKCDCEMIKTLLLNENKNILINDEVKKKSLKLASKNTHHSNDILQLLFDNPNLYIPPPPISLSQLQNPVEPELNDDEEDGEDKQDEEEVREEDGDEDEDEDGYGDEDGDEQDGEEDGDGDEEDEEDEENEDEINEYLDIVLENSEGLKENYNITDSIDDLLIKLEINLKYFSGHYDDILKSKINQILKSQSIKSINEFHYNSYFSNDDCDDDDDDESKLITFLRLILMNEFPNQSKKTMDKIMKNFKKKKIKWHKPLFKSIDSEGKKITIKDKSTFDWIISIDCDEVYKYYNSKKCDFKSFETAIYCLENYNNSREYFDLFSFNTLYSNAIKECNLDQLKTIESLVVDPSGLLSDHNSYKTILTPNSKDDLIKLINYFSDSNFKAFTKHSLILFLFQVFETSLLSPSEIKINIPTTITSPNEIILNAIFYFDFQLLELLLVSLDEFEFEQQDYQRLGYRKKNLFCKELNIFHIEDDFNELYRLIEFIINKFLIGGSGVGGYESACEIINYLYQITLQIKLVTPKQLLKVYELLQLNSVSIKHSLYNAFYYLQIRSAKFTKYILSRPGFDGFLEINYGESYYSSIDYSEDAHLLSHRGFDLGSFLNPDCFTFDYVLGTNENGDYNTPFDQILYQLVYQLSHSIINEIDIIDDFTSLSMNADLEYCLDIRRVGGVNGVNGVWKQGFPSLGSSFNTLILEKESSRTCKGSSCIAIASKL